MLRPKAAGTGAGRKRWSRIDLLPGVLLVLYMGSLLCPAPLHAQAPGSTFETHVLTEEFHSEGAAAADLNRDGHTDIISGPFWYAGPEFKQRNAYAELKRYSIKAYSDHFFHFARDFDGDGWVDILSIPIPGGNATWYRNPGATDGPWEAFLALDDVGNESPLLADIDGNGVEDLICVRGGDFGFASPNSQSPKQPWRFHAISNTGKYGRFTHGLGVGDIDGDGRLDLLEKDGWWQQRNQGFDFVAHPFAESGGSQMFAYDFDGDGDQDVVSVQNAHAWGLRWFERRGTGQDRLFVPHDILTDNPADNPYGLAISQMHALALADIDGDGVKDLITGKRFYAHGGADPGAAQLPVLYWFKTKRTSSGVVFEPHLIHSRVGVGTQLTIADADGDGLADILVGNKLGTYWMRNTGAKPAEARESLTPRHVAGTSEFQLGVRTTEPLTPQQELQSFVLPVGFKAQLVASEPDIAKPLNMAFDHKGRMWVTSSHEYPYPADPGQGRDTIKILEDIDGDGKADNITTFADNLNIPIGLYPYGRGVICYSIPNVLYLEDTDGDDVADKRTVLFGPFDHTRDTHGMCNGFTRGLDGWLYACHGFNNQSVVRGADGHEIRMSSGNTFRMRTDGSRIEHFTHGQVNPFGMDIDPWGELFTADCHTKPITRLLQGGYYESFGKPHDGVGFVPNVMEHLHGSTAIGGIALYHARQFPEYYRDSAFAGNVMTSRVVRNKMYRNNATVRAEEQSDFLISDDPWFRPVDLQVGPDGALYIADFYNRIIGHYEVPLTHPGRDRTSGRIWRVVYDPSNASPDNRGDDVASSGIGSASESRGWAIRDPQHALELLGSSSLKTRLMAADYLADDVGNEAIPQLRALINGSDDENVLIHSMWVLYRLNALSPSGLAAALQDRRAIVRSHALKMVDAFDASVALASIHRGLTDSSRMVQLASVQAAMKFPAMETIPALMQLSMELPSDADYLRHATRMALRDHLQRPTWFADAEQGWDIAQKRWVLPLCPAIKTGFAAEFVIANLGLMDADATEQTRALVEFAARYAPTTRLSDLASYAQDKLASDVNGQEDLLRSIKAGLEQRGESIPPFVLQWAEKLALQYLEVGTIDDTPEMQSTIAWKPGDASANPSDNPWALSTSRSSADGQVSSRLLSSFPKGETRVGTLRSGVFPLPDSFEFFMAGHDGYPDKPVGNKNFVRIRRAQDHRELKRWSPPRNDQAQLFQWQAGTLAGTPVYVELVDGDTAAAYAWLAVGRFSVPSLNPPRDMERWSNAAGLIGDFQLQPFRPMIERLLQSGIAGANVQPMVEAYVGLQGSASARCLAWALTLPFASDARRDSIVAALLSDDSSEQVLALETCFRTGTASQQQGLAERLSSDRPGIVTLVSLVQKGIASPALLQDPAIGARLDSVDDSDLQAQIVEIRKQVPERNPELEKQLEARRQTFLTSGGDPQAGALLFTQHCNQCHQVAGKGKTVGPNLDGIGNRGLARVLEDVLIPNRNIDKAFRASVVLTEDGQVISGLIRGEDGAQLVIVNQKGEETRLPIEAVISRRQTGTSPMPANFHEVLDSRQMCDLIAYLLDLTH